LDLLFILTNLIKIAFIGTYPPRECGIGTFASNLFNSVVPENTYAGISNSGFVVARFMQLLSVFDNLQGVS